MALLWQHCYSPLNWNSGSCNGWIQNWIENGYDLLNAFISLMNFIQFVCVDGCCSLLCSSSFRLFCKEHLCCTTLSEIVLSTDMNNFKGVGGGEGAEGGRKYCCWKLFILLSKLKTYTKKSHYIFNILQKYPGRLIIYIGQISICFISKATPANKR